MAVKGLQVYTANATSQSSTAQPVSHRDLIATFIIFSTMYSLEISM